MNTLTEIEGMLSYLRNSQERTIMRCYVLRRVMNWTPSKVASYLRLTPNTVNSYAQRAAIIFDLKHDRQSEYGKVLTACENCVRRAQLKRQRNELNRVSKRLTNKLKIEA